jgi:hypothetical protein
MSYHSRKIEMAERLVWVQEQRYRSWCADQLSNGNKPLPNPHPCLCPTLWSHVTQRNRQMPLPVLLLILLVLVQYQWRHTPLASVAGETTGLETRASLDEFFGATTKYKAHSLEVHILWTAGK